MSVHRFVCIALSFISVCASFQSALAQQESASRKRPIVIAHRGASGYRPEHTLAAYDLAISLGADYIEPDLVPTKDGVLVARHENEISGTTDVSDHPEFASRRSKKKIDGELVEGWFVEDFTYRELKTIHARERMPSLRQRNTIYNDRYLIPTFQEVIDLAKARGLELGKTIGIYPELKHPTYFASINLPTEDRLLQVLTENKLNDASSPVFIQCFEPSTLKSLHSKTKVPLVQLIEENGKPYDMILAREPLTAKEMVSPTGLARIAKYAQGIGPSKNLLLPRKPDGSLSAATTVVADAHKSGLIVHPWTFRNENSFLPLELRSNPSVAEQNYGDAMAEYKLFYELGVDGVFSENPDTALEVIREGK